MGQAIQFKVITLQGADVTWDFGDGQTVTGSDVLHTYNTPGKRAIKGHVVADPRIGGTEQQFDIDVIDLGVSIDPIHDIIVEGLAHRFTCRGRGSLQRYEWLIDGNVFDGQTPHDASEGQSEIAYTFQTPGMHEIRVVGYAEGAEPESKIRVDVLPRPKVALANGTTCRFGKPAEFSLSAPDGFDSVTWVFGDGVQEGRKDRSVLHTYSQTGAFEASAILTWKSGQQLKSWPITINVVADRPQPHAQICLGGEPIERVVVGETVESIDHSTGDIVKRTWGAMASSCRRARQPCRCWKPVNT